MRSLVRLVTLALAVLLAGASGAQATIARPPGFTAAPHTKVEPLAPGSSTVLMELFVTNPGITTPYPTGHVTGSAVDAEFAAPPIVSQGDPSNARVPLLVTDGHLYNLTAAACEVLAPCTTVPGAPSDTGQTRADGVAPTAGVQINGGAVATNSRDVTLNLSGTDPLIAGLAGSSSGITQFKLDVDGDGTFPCPVFPDPALDQSGCARPFAATSPLAVSAGDGVKSVGVIVGDGARPIVAKCPPPLLCFTLFTNPVIVGNASPAATDTIILDTLKPVAVAAQDRFSVERGGSVSFDASGSVDANGAVGSGVDPAGATWDFKDGTAPATGEKVTHAFAQAGTFVGELRVTDRAGNVSDPRPFSVTVTPLPGDAATGGGSGGAVGAVGAANAGVGTAAFRIDRVTVTGRYRKSRLAGAITIAGTASQPGALRAEIRLGNGKVVRLSTTLAPGAFTKTLKLPATLPPGTYPLVVDGPGGSLNSSLRLLAPQEGVIRSGRVAKNGAGALATFALASQPAKALRSRLTVVWSQGGRALGPVKVTSGARIVARLPVGATVGAGKLKAELRARGVVVGSAVA